jgi:dihydrodipicolinate synthase/N-acetylneuraminate lyase
MNATRPALLDLRGVFAVPPLARRSDAARSLDFAGNDRIVRHIADGGIRRFLYGGNAFLYHLTLAEYEALVDWLATQSPDLWMIPSAGPSFGRAMDQAPLLRRHSFPVVMMLPCADPRDAAGLERGLREFADAAGCRLVLYLKEETNFGPDREAGLDVVARLVDEGICSWIKYAVVRPDPARDPYLDALLSRVDPARVVSGMGERPAVVHLEERGLPGFTTGSGCIRPALSQRLLEAASRGDFDEARRLREHFLPLEDLRDAWGPARVLHQALEAAGIADTGPIPPFVSPLAPEQLAQVAPVARQLAADAG